MTDHVHAGFDHCRGWTEQEATEITEILSVYLGLLPVRMDMGGSLFVEVKATRKLHPIAQLPELHETALCSAGTDHQFSYTETRGRSIQVKSFQRPTSSESAE